MLRKTYRKCVGNTTSQQVDVPELSRRIRLLLFAVAGIGAQLVALEEMTCTTK
jgi:hypothetical protein